mgnify:CR=1 FL=1
MSQLVVVIQCDIVTKRCSGYACMNTFVNRVDTMADYPPDTRFLMMTCGAAAVPVSRQNSKIWRGR